MNYPAADLRGIKKKDVIDQKISLNMSFRQSLSRNPVPYEKTLDSRSESGMTDTSFKSRAIRHMNYPIQDT